MAQKPPNPPKHSNAASPTVVQKDEQEEGEEDELEDNWEVTYRELLAKREKERLERLPELLKILPSLSEFFDKYQAAYSVETARSKRNLLVVSLAAVAIITTGSIPTRIESLGIEFHEPQAQAITIILSLVTAYYLLAFLVNYYNDRNIRTTLRETYRDIIQSSRAQNYIGDSFGLGDPFQRRLVDFYIPVISGVGALAISLFPFTPESFRTWMGGVYSWILGWFT